MPGSLTKVTFVSLALGLVVCVMVGYHMHRDPAPLADDSSKEMRRQNSEQFKLLTDQIRTLQQLEQRHADEISKLSARLSTQLSAQTSATTAQISSKVGASPLPSVQPSPPPPRPSPGTAPPSPPPLQITPSPPRPNAGNGHNAGKCRVADWVNADGPCSGKGDMMSCGVEPPKCVCNHLYKGPKCDQRKQSTHSHLQSNVEKYKDYTKKYCSKKLSMSGNYQDADLMAMAKDYLKTEGITPALKQPLKVFDSCLGCGGFGTMMSRENIPTVFDGNDLSRDAIDWVAQNVKNANKLWDVDSSKGFNFILNDTYDLSLAWFCLNNIALLSKDKKTAGCDLVKDLIRITRSGGMVWLGMYYERDCPGLGNDFPLNFFTGGKDGCKLEGTTVYQHHTLHKRYGFDRYCRGTMKSTWLKVD